MLLLPSLLLLAGERAERLALTHAGSGTRNPVQRARALHNQMREGSLQATGAQQSANISFTAIKIHFPRFPSDQSTPILSPPSIPGLRSPFHATGRFRDGRSPLVCATSSLASTRTWRLFPGWKRPTSYRTDTGCRFADGVRRHMSLSIALLAIVAVCAGCQRSQLGPAPANRDRQGIRHSVRRSNRP